MPGQPNIIVVVSDTLRAGDLGCYGGEADTPHIDAFAKTAVRFTEAYPESLPTIPVRRALHTGRRCYPFPTWEPVPWDIVFLPGWQPIARDEDTLAENLAAAGYHTGFVTDTLPYFAPGFNFTRGFWQWDFVRGQQQDRWKSPYAVPDDVLARYGDPKALRGGDGHGTIAYHLANTAGVRSEEDTSTARVFRSATDFLADNRDGQPFYLLVDCFDPHEPWEAPESYLRRYWGDRPYSGRRLPLVGYAPADRLGYTAEEIAHIRANYLGLVSLVDHWFGVFLAKLDALGYGENTAVVFTSDHGTNFCDNPRNVIGKPDTAMYPGVMRLPLLARIPGATRPGAVSGAIVTDVDIPATAYDLACVASARGIDGRSLVPLVRGDGDARGQDYVTCRYNNSLVYVDRETWALGRVDGTPQEVFDRASDPACMTDIAGTDDGRRRWGIAWDRLRADAGGSFVEYHRERTDAVGQTPVRP